MIRNAEFEDAAAISAILSDTLTPWSVKNVEESIESECHTVLVYGKPIDGVLIYSRVCDEAEILNFAVKKEKRRKGIGEKLLAALTEKNRTVYLDVRESNAAAIALYTKKGFMVTGKRKDFYDNPKENAVLMALS